MLTYRIYDNSKYKYKYGNLIASYMKDDKWVEDWTSERVVFSNMNSKSIIQTYVDGLDKVMLKHNLARMTFGEKYVPKTSIIEKSRVIKDGNLRTDMKLWLKPSHAYVGHGSDIIQLENMDEFYKKQKDGTLNKYVHWVLQEDISPGIVMRYFCIVIVIYDNIYIFTCKSWKQWGTDIVMSDKSLSDGMERITKIVLSKIQLFGKYIGYNLLGLDYIVKDDVPYLIEINSNAELPKHHVHMNGILIPDILQFFDDMYHNKISEYPNWTLILKYKI